MFKKNGCSGRCSGAFGVGAVGKCRRISPAKSESARRPAAACHRRLGRCGLLAAGMLALVLPRASAEDLTDSLKRLKSPDVAVRRQVAEELAWMEDRARLVAPELTVLLEDEDPFVRAHAALALWTIDRQAYAAVPVLADLLDSPRPGVRPLAAYFLGQIGPEASAALPALRRVMAAGEGLERLQIADAIMRVEPGDESTLNSLVEGLQSPEGNVRFFAACALGDCAGEHADVLVSALSAALDDPDEKVRTAAVLALETFRMHQRAESDVLHAADSRDAEDLAEGRGWRPAATGATGSAELDDRQPTEPEARDYDGWAARIEREELELGEPGLPPVRLANRQPEDRPSEAPAPMATDPLPRMEGEEVVRREPRPVTRINLNVMPPTAYEDEDRTVPAETQMPESVYVRDRDVIEDVPAIYHPPGYHSARTTRSWLVSSFWWDAPAMSHRPLYLEEAYLERYGYHFGCVQPIVSGGYFFGRLPALPYLKTVDHPNVAQYTLGQYRPGSPVPMRHERIPLRADAAAVQALTVMVWAFAL